MNLIKIFKVLGISCSVLLCNSIRADCRLITYDFIIVGNGTAGAVLARELSENQSKKVLVLEAGVNHDDDPRVLQTSGPDLLNTFTELTYDTEYSETWATQAVNPLSSVPYSVGRGWGGSSLHHYLNAVRGTENSYDQWVTITGDASWSYNNLLPLFKAQETYTPNAEGVFNASQRGSSGPIHFTQRPSVEADPLAVAINAGLGIPFVNDYNDPTVGKICISPYQLFAYPGAVPGETGDRSFSTNAYLPRSVVSTNGVAQDGRLLRIESNILVDRVLFDGNVATGVEFTYNKNPKSVRKAYGRKIILCAGSVNSPAILQRSGIGDAKMLESLGIKAIVNNPNVGANALNHYGPSSVLLGPTMDPTTLPFLQVFSNSTGQAAPYDYPDDDQRRIQWNIAPISPPGTPFGVSQCLGFLMDPQSKGKIEIRSADPNIQPNIDLNMYSDGPYTQNGTDANIALTFYKNVENIAGVTRVFPAPGSTDEELFQAAVGASGLIVASHISGTTRMAASIEDGVVDSRLHVFGVENLMVADLSSAPTLPDGNTCAAALVIGLKAAQILGVNVAP